MIWSHRYLHPCRVCTQAAVGLVARPVVVAAVDGVGVRLIDAGSTPKELSATLYGLTAAGPHSSAQNTRRLDVPFS